MVVVVVSRIRQALARSTFYSSVVGDSMLARLRSTTIGLLGLVTAVGLGLVAFISQLGFPGVFNGAIPDGPGGSAAVHGAIALTPAGGTAQRVRGGHVASVRVQLPSALSLHAPGTAPGSVAGPNLGSLNQAGHAPTVGRPPPGHVQPPAMAPPGPPGEQASTTESPPPAAASPKSESPVQPEKSSSTKTKPKSTGHSSEKAKSQADAKPAASSTGGSKSHRSAAKAKRHSGAPSKQAGDSPGSSGESNASPAKGSSPPPSAGPGGKAPPEARENGDAGKDAGKSGKSHH
jgi:hypothetical protein